MPDPANRGFKDGPSAEAQFNGNAVRMLSDTGQVTTLVQGVPSGNVDGPLTTAKVNAPTGIWCDGTSLFIADRDNQLIRRID